MGSPFPSSFPTNGPPQWGLYNSDGSPALVASSVKGVEYAHDYRNSDYQQEQGAFATYNKVQTPFMAKIIFSVGGPLETRSAFLNQAEAVVASLNLVAIITPEIQYASANPFHIGYRRTKRQGVTLLLVEIWVEEIRVLGAATLSNTASSNGANPAQDGVLQPGPALTSAPSGATPATTLTTSAAANQSNYQFFNLAPPATQNLSQTSDFYVGPF